MTMPRTKQYEPDRIAGIAMNVFWTQGYGATSIEDLAEATGLSRSSLYSEYGSKRELFSTALNHYLEYFGTRLAPLSEGGLDALEAFFQQVSADQPDKPAGCLMVNTMTELVPPDPSFADDADLYRIMIKDAFSDALATAETRGEIDSGSPGRRADFLTTQLFGLFVELRAQTSRTDIERSVEGVIAEVRSWKRLSLKRRLGDPT